MGSILSVTGIKKQFGAHVVLDGIDMELESGKIYHLMGPNGSGKTTLINIISGLFAPDAGRILFNESDISHKGMLNTYKSGLIRTWQIPQPFSLLTTLENITVSSPKNRGESFLNAVLKSRWRSDEKRITDDAVDIMKTTTLFEKEGIKSMNLSGGQQKLLELGRSMMSGATMILMDEPIAGVNPKLAHEIFEMITKICCDQHITFLIVEHRLDIALQYAHHVFALNRGKIIMQGKPDAVVKHPEVIESYLGR